MVIITNNIINTKLSRIKSYKLVVGMTTWPARIEYIRENIESICKQKIVPDEFYLILSKKEFPNADLPKYIDELQSKYNFFKILWVNNNIKQFKKNLPLLQKYWNRNDVIVFTADDDVIYNPDYIFTVCDKFLELNENRKTILTYNFGWPLENPTYYEKDTRRVIGKFEILIPSFFISPIVLNIEENDINKENIWVSEDWWITYNLRKNKKLKWYHWDFSNLNSLIFCDKIKEIKPLEDIYKYMPEFDKLSSVVELYRQKAKGKILLPNEIIF